MKSTILALSLAMLFIAPQAMAVTVYLNGVDITDVRDKEFKNIKEMRIDKDGNIHLTAPQYEVKVVTDSDSDTSSSTTETAAVSNAYFIVTQGNGKQAQFDLYIVVNGTPVKTIKAGEGPVIEEISKHLKKGSNEIIVTAKKNAPTGRISTKKSDELKLIIGRGHTKNKIVKIDKVSATFTCNASQNQDITKTYEITAQ